MAGGETRNQMMQNLFGDQSEEEEEEEEDDEEENHPYNTHAAADGEDDREPYQSVITTPVCLIDSIPLMLPIQQATRYFVCCTSLLGFQKGSLYSLSSS